MESYACPDCGFTTKNEKTIYNHLFLKKTPCEKKDNLQLTPFQKKAVNDLSKRRIKELDIVLIKLVEEDDNNYHFVDLGTDKKFKYEIDENGVIKQTSPSIDPIPHSDTTIYKPILLA
jgi:hypothetical protein